MKPRRAPKPTEHQVRRQLKGMTALYGRKCQKCGKAMAPGDSGIMSTLVCRRCEVAG